MLLAILIILFIIGCILANSIYKEGFECSDYTCSAGYVNANPSKSCGSPPVSSQYIEAPNYPQNAYVASFCPAGTTFNQYACGENALASLPPTTADAQYGPYTSNDYLQVPGVCWFSCNCNNVWVKCDENDVEPPPDCTSNICCTPTCATISCDNMHIRKPAGTVCSGSECTSEECCIAKPTCGGFNCAPGSTLKNDSPKIACTQEPCANSECCFENERCSEYVCPNGETNESEGNITHTCSGQWCTEEECCGKFPTCTEYQGAIGLDGRYAEGDPRRYTGGWATGTENNASECDTLCQGQPECSYPGMSCHSTFYSDGNRCYCSFHITDGWQGCVSDFYNKRALLPNADSIQCNSPICTNDECCSSTPSGQLPKIQTWPLYP